jgi:carbamoyl-phosphate synthase large subunit
VAAKIGFPVVVRPSYVLGGRAMAIVYDVAALDRYMAAPWTCRRAPDPHRPLPRGRLRARRGRVADATGAVVIGGIMEHIEEAGIHSGDSSCVVPPYLVPSAPRDHSRLHAAHRARAEGGRPDERAVRHQGRHGLRARGEPARVAHGAVPVEGDRRAAGEGRGARDGGRTLAELGLVDDLDGCRRVRQDARCSRSCASPASTRSSGPR